MECDQSDFLSVLGSLRPASPILEPISYFYVIFTHSGLTIGFLFLATKVILGKHRRHSRLRCLNLKICGWSYAVRKWKNGFNDQKVA